jgi:hypothetical protein
MISALLDPWPFQIAADGDFEALNVLSKFDELVRRHHINVVPFITDAEWDNLREIIGARYGRTVGYSTRLSTARIFIRDTSSHCAATPVPEPPRLTKNWKCALGTALTAEDWRNPQIVIPESRRADWGTGDEASIQIETRGGMPSGELHKRVLTVLERYDAHPFALSDFDPWDLRHVHQPPEGAPPHMRHPCFLPKPPCLNGVRLENLTTVLEEAGNRRWNIGERWYFIPPGNWRPDDISKDAWRTGRAFARKEVLVRKKKRMGYLDFRGIVWLWDDAHRHWDVQTRPYLRLRCTGEKY